MSPDPRYPDWWIPYDLEMALPFPARRDRSGGTAGSAGLAANGRAALLRRLPSWLVATPPVGEKAVSDQQSFYLARAAEARAEAAAAKLENVRQRCLRAEEAWLAMAHRVGDARARAMR